MNEESIGENKSAENQIKKNAVNNIEDKENINTLNIAPAQNTVQKLTNIFFAKQK
jgi:hypothetical protein